MSQNLLSATVVIGALRVKLQVPPHIVFTSNKGSSDCYCVHAHACLFCLFVLILYVQVSNFSVMSGRVGLLGLNQY